ncbi:MAG TPA: NBR1-Ig-like domain-containing protein [Anaerolineales bacterium]|nr:NBR1-Ig-like domain-containing protein [Anaerolineales bacterium]
MFVRKSMRQAVLNLAIAAVLMTACSMGATPEPTVDVDAINTAAVATAMGQLSAQFTQTALAGPSSTSLPTNTALPLPTFALPTAGAGTPVATGALPTVSFNTTPTTPLPGFTALASPVAPAATTSLGDACNNNQFVSDVTVPDGSVLEPGQNFVKTWSLQNTGTCTWDDGYTLVYIGGSSPNLDPYDFEFTDGDDFVTGGETANLSLTLTTPCTPGDYQGTWRMRDDRGNYFGTPLTVVVKVTDDC